MGRPKLDVDFDKLAILCQYPLRNEDIADLMDLSMDTISRAIKKKFNVTFAEYKEQKQSKLRFTLLQKQVEVAKAGNVVMLIWLGKQYLGQSDVEKSEIKQLQKDVENIHEKIDILKLVKNE